MFTTVVDVIVVVCRVTQAIHSCELLTKKACLSQVAQQSLCRVRVAALTAAVGLDVDQVTEAGRGTAALAPHRRSSPVRPSVARTDN